MPVKNAHRTAPAYQHYKQISYENLAASWFTADGWEVFMPVTDHDRKTDLVVADDNHYYRIQVKSLENGDDNVFVENKWREAQHRLCYLFLSHLQLGLYYSRLFRS